MRVVLPLLALVSSACNCEQALPLGGVAVEFDHEPLEPGLYEVVLTGDGETVECVMALPDEAPDCTDGTAMVVGYNGTRILDFNAWWFAPETFTITVRRDGEVLASQDYAPEYTVHGSERCGQARGALVELAF